MDSRRRLVGACGEFAARCDCTSISVITGACCGFDVSSWALASILVSVELKRWRARTITATGISKSWCRQVSADRIIKRARCDGASVSFAAGTIFGNVAFFLARACFAVTNKRFAARTLTSVHATVVWGWEVNAPSVHRARRSRTGVDFDTLVIFFVKLEAIFAKAESASFVVTVWRRQILASRVFTARCRCTCICVKASFTIAIKTYIAKASAAVICTLFIGAHCIFIAWVHVACIQINALCAFHSFAYWARP
jgi:hypothetical protein